MSDVEQGKITSIVDEANASPGATHVEMDGEKLLSFVAPSNKESTFGRNSPEMLYGVLIKREEQ